ncbi:hypothetical protein AB0I81_34435 [Nonomuraea sp. NPDC050404]|uniref:hypothetical protein n=1 Tax=Nonomuraea sp. NPDC050404 TaxID=3155783 RepID=UPI0033F7C367
MSSAWKWKTAGAAVVVTAALFAVVPSAHSADPPSLRAAAGTELADPPDEELEAVEEEPGDEGTEPSPDDAALLPAPDPDSESGSEEESTPSAENTGSTGVCVFSTMGDYVHISGSAFEASGHGWWVKGNCKATHAVVTVQLQQQDSGGSWRNAGTVGKATVPPGGGGGKRATGRAVCNSAAKTSWRSIVDVDLVGVMDDPGKLTTATRDLNCRN